MSRTKINLAPAFSEPKVKFPAEHIGRQFSTQMHPSNVTNALHGYYEADREQDFITQHPFGLDNQTHN